MGGWFAQFLSSQGFAVEIADPARRRARSRESPIGSSSRLRAGLIIVATPMKIAGAILLALVERSPTA